MAGNDIEGLTGWVELKDATAIRSGEIHRIAGNRIQHLPQIQRRADRPANVAKSANLFERKLKLAGALLNFLEQPHVLNGNHRLVGEGRHKLDLFVSKRLDLSPEDNDHANRNAFPEQRHSEYRSWFEELGTVVVVWIGPEIRDVYGLALQYDSAGDGVSPTAWRVLLNEFQQVWITGVTIGRYQRKGVILCLVNRSMIGFAKPASVFNQCVKNRLKIER